ncbi:MAG: MoxR family ATPase [Lachnospiraceae bacterium]|nr:MoxR family ATPase [Lachnospiraceae bacterium]
MAEVTTDQLQDVISRIQKTETEIGKAIIGQKDIIRQTILAILADGNVLLEGVPGLGKTELVKAVSRVMDMSFSRIQFTPDLMPADVTGTSLIVQEEGRNRFQFEPGPIFAQLVLADEINRATPKTQAALLEAMQEKTVTSGRTTYSLPQPFMVLATQNPIENEGTYPLPEAQLDRFLFKLLVEFPDKEELRQIVNITVGRERPELQMIMTGDDIITARDVIRQVPIADAVMDHALNIVVGTHPDRPQACPSVQKYVSNGASPRAAQAIIKTARARALLEGRYNVSFDDINYVAYPALRHRLITNFEAIADGMTPDKIIREIIGSFQ